MKRFVRLLRTGIITDLGVVASAILGLMMKPTSLLPATRMKTTPRLCVTGVSRRPPADLLTDIEDNM